MAVEILKPSVVQGFRDTLKTSSVPQAIDTSTPPVAAVVVNSMYEKKPVNGQRFFIDYTGAAADTTGSIQVGSESGNVFIIETASISCTNGGTAQSVYINAASNFTIMSVDVAANAVVNQQVTFPSGIKVLPGETISFNKDNVAGSAVYAFVIGYKRPFQKDIDNIPVQMVNLT